MNGMRQHLAFPRRSGGGNWPSATLIDTELREVFRGKNTARKSFFGHARLLNDLPIAAATARPTQRFAAHGGTFVGPRSATGEARVFFGFRDCMLIALHAILNKTQKTPTEDLALARQQFKELQSWQGKVRRKQPSSSVLSVRRHRAQYLTQGWAS
jgi:hypothetical protein